MHTNVLSRKISSEMEVGGMDRSYTIESGAGVWRWRLSRILAVAWKWWTLNEGNVLTQTTRNGNIASSAGDVRGSLAVTRRWQWHRTQAPRQWELKQCTLFKAGGGYSTDGMLLELKAITAACLSVTITLTALNYPVNGTNAYLPLHLSQAI